MGRNKAAPSFADCPQLALSAIHDVLLHGSNVDEGFCGRPATQHAASFRMACKAFHGAGACLPSILKLAFEEPPCVETCRSLAQMLSMSAHTQLGLRFQNITQHKDDYQGSWLCVLGDQHYQDGLWIFPLTRSGLAKRVVKLEIPTNFLNAALSACRALPALKELVLHVSKDTQMGNMTLRDRSQATNTNDCDLLCEGKLAAAWLGQSQLSTLTISAASGAGQAPFAFMGDDPPFPLTALPCFHTLVLRGPIVQQDISHFSRNQSPLSLPPDAKVVIDPGFIRRPTAWARSVVVYDRFADMPANVIPKADEYCEEDADARQWHMSRFRSLVLNRARALIPDESEWGINDKNDVNEHLDAWELREVMTKHGIAARSYLLERVVPINELARDIAERAWRGTGRSG